MSGVQPGLRGRSSWLPVTTVVALLATALLSAGVWLAYGNLQRTEATDTLAEQVREAQLATETLLSTLKDAESGQRGYLLTGNPDYLQPYDAARRRLDSDFERVERLPPLDAGLSAHIARLRDLAAAKLAELGQTIALRQAGRSDKALELVQTDRGKRLMDEIRAEVHTPQADTQASLARAEAADQLSRGWMEAAGLSAAAGVLLAGVALNRGRARRRLAASMARLERFTRAFGLAPGMLRDLDGRITFWNFGTERLYGFTPAEALGRISHELLHTRFPVPRAQIEAALLRDGHWQGELVHRRRDGSEITVESQWALHRGSAGETDAVIELNTDVTGLRRAEVAREHAAALLRAVMDAAPGLIYAKDRAGRLLLANPPVMSLVGKSWSEIEGRTDLEIQNDKLQAQAVMDTDRRVMESGQIEELEELVGGEGLLARVWLSTKTPLRDGDGVVVGLVGLSVEITERKRAEERLRLLVHELNHRVKNTLATVQAIASQTLRDTDRDVWWTLEARLLALASAHDVLALERWGGADLYDVVEKVLTPYGGLRDRRFRISGPSLRLVPGAALALAMGLHELATNAVKYGALTSETGLVQIRWEIVPGDVPQFRLVWTEQGGPPIAPPVRRGFGTKLVERSLALDLGGTSRITFGMDGVSCVVEAPLAEVAAAAEMMAFPAVGVMHGMQR